MKATVLTLLSVILYGQLVSCAHEQCSAITKPICDSLQEASVTCKCRGSTSQCLLDSGGYLFSCPDSERYKWGRDTCADFCTKGGSSCDNKGCYN